MRHEIIASPPCPNDEGHVTYLHTKYDAVLCLACDLWLEGTCKDPKCRYCPTRPEKPSQAVEVKP